jgi:hypothetical protein
MAGQNSRSTCGIAKLLCFTATQIELACNTDPLRLAIKTLWDPSPVITGSMAEELRIFHYITKLGCHACSVCTLRSHARAGT